MIVDGNTLLHTFAMLMSFCSMVYVFMTMWSDINYRNKSQIEAIFNYLFDDADKKFHELNMHLDLYGHRFKGIDSQLENVQERITDNKRLLDAHTSAFNDFYSKLKDIEALSKESIDLNKTAFKMYITGGKDKVIAQEMSQRVDGIIQGVVSYEDESKKNSKKS